MNKLISILLIAITLTVSTSALCAPHPRLVHTARFGLWDEFKDFLQQHPEELEALDDSIFILIHRAGRMDVLDGRPRPSAPPADDFVNSNHPAPSAPEPDENEQAELDALLARALQDEEYRFENNPEPPQLVREPRANRKICNLQNMLTGMVLGLAAYLVWNDSSI